MTSQSPRIYLYKVTFEEVSYYYYGVHKEKYFNEKYWGTPITNKWCWELYTPKKQILQLFDFTDEGWIKAQEVEKRLIRPVYNTDKWCLNENCGGMSSLNCLKKGYIKNKNQLPYNEQTKLKSKWIYANNKKEAERIFLKEKIKINLLATVLT